MAALNEAARKALEEWMDPQAFPTEELWTYKKGEAKGEAKALLRVLDRRGIVVPESGRERILKCTDTAQIEAWLDRALVASTVEEVLGTE